MLLFSFLFVFYFSLSILFFFLLHSFYLILSLFYINSRTGDYRSILFWPSQKKFFLYFYLLYQLFLMDHFGYLMFLFCFYLLFFTSFHDGFAMSVNWFLCDKY